MSDLFSALAGIGRVLLVVALVGLAGSIAGLVLFAMRRGGAAEEPEFEINPSLPGGPPRPGLRIGGGGAGRWMGVQRSTGLVSIRSLVEGTASPQERLMVLGIHVAMLSLWLLFISIAMMILPSRPLASLFAAAIPTAWLTNILRTEWQEFADARRAQSQDRGGGTGPSGK